ncbi:MAG: GSCFA domain-containing protein [Lentisphaeria bacterium]|nr:GSCFA domain-containing protein [Lentisphaeria bacterium]NQZ70166.1 GSCFA domain-containing protein [Lentisphaeria bacterium]
MVSFRTVVEIDAAEFSLNHQHTVFSIGSCFVENIAEKFPENGFRSMSNPFGTQYNPISIFKSIKRIIEARYVETEAIIQHNDLYCHPDFHGEFNCASQNQFCKHVNAKIFAAHECLKEADLLIISLGTAFSYRSKESGKIVSNCHKMPADKFSRELLTLEYLESEFTAILQDLRDFNDSVHVILTVSPIRHWRDNPHMNQVSKSTLIMLTNRFNTMEKLAYFPSYEIVLDELRDYRFYREDMIHLNSTAIDYIWQRFSDYCIDSKSQQIITDLQRLKKQYQHKVLSPESTQYQIHLDSRQAKYDELSEKYNEIDFVDLIQNWTR